MCSSKETKSGQRLCRPPCFISFEIRFDIFILESHIFCSLTIFGAANEMRRVCEGCPWPGRHRYDFLVLSRFSFYDELLAPRLELRLKKHSEPTPVPWNVFLFLRFQKFRFFFVLARGGNKHDDARSTGAQRPVSVFIYLLHLKRWEGIELDHFGGDCVCFPRCLLPQAS